MDHENIQSKLFEFYDGSLSLEDQRLVGSHIESCPECGKDSALWSAARKALPKAAACSVSLGFSERVMRKIRPPAFEFWGLPRWEFLATLSVSSFIFFYFTLHFAESPGAGTENPIDLVYSEVGEAPAPAEDIIPEVDFDE